MSDTPGDPYGFASPAEYRQLILKVYAENDLDFGGLFADTLPYLTERPPTAELSDRAKVLLYQVDEAVTFLLLVSMKVQAYLVDDATPARVTFSALLSSITSSLAGIRQLVGQGLILPATQLCRPLRDTVNVALLCVSTTEIANRFAGTFDPTAANRFWHEFLARDRDLKAIDRALELHVGSAAALFPHVEAELNEMLGMMVHPSAAGGTVAMMNDAAQLFFPDPGAVRAAHRPLSFAAHQAFRLMLGVFRPSVLPGELHVETLIPEADQALVASLRRSIVELYLFTIVRLSRRPWANSPPR